MRLSLMKAAHADVGGAPWQEIRVARRFRPTHALAHGAPVRFPRTFVETSELGNSLGLWVRLPSWTIPSDSPCSVEFFWFLPILHFLWSSSRERSGKGA